MEWKNHASDKSILVNSTGFELGIPLNKQFSLCGDRNYIIIPLSQRPGLRKPQKKHFFSGPTTKAFTPQPPPPFEQSWSSNLSQKRILTKKNHTKICIIMHQERTKKSFNQNSFTLRGAFLRLPLYIKDIYCVPVCATVALYSWTNQNILLYKVEFVC